MRALDLFVRRDGKPTAMWLHIVCGAGVMFGLLMVAVGISIVFVAHPAIIGGLFVGGGIFLGFSTYEYDKNINGPDPYGEIEHSDEALLAMAALSFTNGHTVYDYERLRKAAKRVINRKGIEGAEA